MRLIDVQAFLEREGLIKEGKQVDRRAKVVECGDDEVTEYAILSHRWIEPEEVDYNEVVKLAKMAEEERSEIRQCGGYQKILQSCEQAKKDGYKWLWVDTCCIDKGSSAELSEAINLYLSIYKRNGQQTSRTRYARYPPLFPPISAQLANLDSAMWHPFFGSFSHVVDITQFQCPLF